MIDSKNSEKVAILGASSGLGRSFARVLGESEFSGEVFLSSRKMDRLEIVRKEIFAKVQNAVTVSSDYSNPSDQQELIQKLLLWQPDRVIYCAGGGPHGSFAKKEWKDHQWSLEVSFLFPSRLLHVLLQKQVCRQVVFVGSHIAERADNSQSPSYGAAKNGLRNLIRSVNSDQNEVDVRLFSPGYMDTQMLPPNAPPRKEFQLLDPDVVAQELLAWIESSTSDWHKQLANP